MFVICRPIFINAEISKLHMKRFIFSFLNRAAANNHCTIPCSTKKLKKINHCGLVNGTCLAIIVSLSHIKTMKLLLELVSFALKIIGFSQSF